MSSVSVEDEWLEPFSVEVVGLGEGTTVVIVHGEVDILTGPDLYECLVGVVEHRPKRLVLDLGDMAFLDCAGARVLARARRSLGPSSTMILWRPSPLVRKVLAVTGTAGLYVIEDLDWAGATGLGAD